MRATEGEGAAARAALDELLVAYWFPLYGYLRRAGETDAEAREAVQDFVATLLERDAALGPDPERGRFRSYLAAALKNHVAKRRRAERTLRRGEGAGLDLGAAEARYGALSADAATPEEVFERTWALEVLGRARRRLAEECEASGRGDLFRALEDTLDGSNGRRTHAERAEALGRTEGALKVAAHRLRDRLGALLREEVGHTVAGQGDVEAELRVLAAALAGNSAKPM